MILLFYLFEYVIVTMLMLISFVLFKAIIRRPVSAESIKILLNGSFISFIISACYTLLITFIDKIYGSDKSSAIVMMLLLIINLSLYICFTVFYYNKKSGNDL